MTAPASLRITYATCLVAAHLLAHPHGGHGYAIAQATGLDRRAVSSVLHRLQAAGYATCQVEQVDPREAARPRRHVYRLTKNGRAWAAEMADVERFAAANVVRARERRPR